MGRVSGNRRWLKCTQREGRWGAFFYETSLPFCFVLSGSKSSLVYIIFRLLSNIPRTQFIRLFCWGNTCVLFILGKKCTSSYATLTTYVAFPQGHRRLVYFWKQVWILLWHPCNLGSMSKEFSGRYSTLTSECSLDLFMGNNFLRLKSKHTGKHGEHPTTSKFIFLKLITCAIDQRSTYTRDSIMYEFRMYDSCL